MKKEIEKIIRPELFQSVSSAGTVILKEDDTGAALRVLSIKRLPKGSIVFELDHSPKGSLKRRLGNAFKQLSCILNSNHDKINKKCDYVIVYKKDKEIRILLCDLKSNRLKRSDCAAQLKNSELFVKYLLSLLAEYHNINITPVFMKTVIHVAQPINAKAPTQQKNRQKATEFNGVKYLPVTVAGRNNSNAITVFEDVA
ncbi:hypothetical protein J7444_08620 [Labrenzia sp. R4_1]|uniref:hypothetical protein n=1 Tax=Labrenzia sp. R4_1 TaxID=2821106 RepID=UPI001ADB5982|nr:hypothetical protein [Labrenzia sp. R4_1]MBO9424782.1 hypothetical protein [Labrenzia sp. R4_1]